MEDKRIQKTKKNLKDTMLRMMETVPFDKIKVTDICREANTSRITFYTYYGDKTALLEDCFQDLFELVNVYFEKKQKQNNTENEPIQGCVNLMDAIFDMEEMYPNVEKMLIADNSYFLMSSYYWPILHLFARFVRQYEALMQPEYSTNKVCSFLCNGIWGFIWGCREENCSRNEIRRQCRELVRAMLSSGIFMQK